MAKSKKTTAPVITETAVVNLPQSYAITKSTPIMRDLLREAFTNNKGKLFTVDDVKKLCNKKWVNGFLYYTTRANLDANAECDFPLVQVKKDRKVVGYRYQPLVNSEEVKYRNTKGHIVTPTNIIGKWEAKPTQRAINAQQAAAEAAAAVTNSEKTEAAEAPVTEPTTAPEQMAEAA